MPDKAFPSGLITALRGAPLAAIVIVLPAAPVAQAAVQPDAAAVSAPPIQLQARVSAVRAALARAAGSVLDGAAPGAATMLKVAQSPNWTNWPKWSKWSNWANK